MTNPRPAQSVTPTPWYVDDELPPSDRGVFVRVGRFGVPISSDEPYDSSPLTNEDAKARNRADARLIVTAVNAHAEAVELAREVVALFTSDRFGKAWYMDGSEFYRDAHKVEESARSLLAKSEGRDGEAF
jgi:hypothetical protein